MADTPFQVRKRGDSKTVVARTATRDTALAAAKPLAVANKAVYSVYDASHRVAAVAYPDGTSKVYL